MEGTETLDYTQQLSDILTVLGSMNELLKGIASLIIFFVIVLLCYFAYKFFNMFFK